MEEKFTAARLSMRNKREEISGARAARTGAQSMHITVRQDISDGMTHFCCVRAYQEKK
jgi:hypothetical protein